MTLRFYNTAARRLEEFVPPAARPVTMYHCGPTVYSHPHIGNFRSFLFADVLRRTLEFRGWAVTQVMNITDVGHLTQDDVEAGEDKMEAAARKEKKDPWQIAEFYANEFLDLVDVLHVRRAHHYPRATQHIPEMIQIIQKLIDRGLAYVVNGNVYYDVTRFSGYGRLSGNTLDQLMAGARIEINPEKKSPMDFALWKQDPKHIMQWDSPWGRGFPGWHIECSAMSMKYLGESFDIHTGGEDNIFPHHESEIAQSEGASGKKFVSMWMHARHLLVDGKKMSKSDGNFHTVRDILGKGYHPMVLRYALISVHYRQPLNFTFEGLDAARAAVQRLTDFRDRLKETAGTSSQIPDLAAFERVFTEAMDDDLNISKALSVVFDFVNAIHRMLDQGMGKAGADAASNLLNRFDSVLGILERSEAVTLDAEIEKLIQEREAARKQKNFKRSDEIRDQLLKRGIVLEDRKDGVRWKRTR